MRLLRNNRGWSHLMVSSEPQKEKAWSPSPPPPVSDVEKCRSSVVPRDGGLLVLTGTAVTTPVVAAAVIRGGRR